MIHAHGIPQLALQVQIGPLLTSAIGQLLMSGRCLSTEMCQVQEYLVTDGPVACTFGRIMPRTMTKGWDYATNCGTNCQHFWHTFARDPLESTGGIVSYSGILHSFQSG